MRSSKLVLLAVGLASCIMLLSGCKKKDDDPQDEPAAQLIVKARFTVREGSQGFTFGSSTIEDAVGREILLTRMRFLLTDYRLTDAAGDPIQTFPGVVIQWDSNDPNATTTLGTVTMLNYGGVSMTIGLDDTNNGTSPSDHTGPPLSDQSLYIGSGIGYLFYQIQGRADANNDGIVSPGEGVFSYTCVGASMRRTDHLSFSGSVASAVETLNIGVDVTGLLNGVNVMADLNETGSGPLNAQLMSNLQTAIEES